MKLRTILFTSIIIAASFSGTTAVTAQSGVSTAAERCELAQSYLRNILKTRDLYARVDRLQAYQYIYHRLDIFARRLERNNQAGAVEMRTSLTKLQASLETFKLHYEEYDTAREETTNLKNCRSNLAQFQSKLEVARNKRELVHQDILNIQAILETELEPQISALYQQLSKGGTQ